MAVIFGVKVVGAKVVDMGISEIVEIKVPSLCRIY